MSIRWRAALANLCAAALLLALLPWPRLAMASGFTYTVTTTLDAPHAMPLDETCTSTLKDKACTLRAAMQAANYAGTGQHTIHLAVAGTYTLTVVGPNEDAGATGDLDIQAQNINVTVDNTSGGAITISGPGGKQNDRVFDVATGAIAVIPQFTISDVTIKSGSVQGADGGGIRSGKGAILTLNKVTLIGNSADHGGGLSSLGTATLTDVKFSDNVATLLGGGLYNEAVDLTLTSVTFSNNSTTDKNSSGGGLASTGAAKLTNVVFDKNQAQLQGGGIYNEGVVTANTFTFTNNVAHTAADMVAGGGAIASVGQVTLTKGTFDSNAAVYGGGVFNGGHATLTDVTLKNNKSDKTGAAIFNRTLATLTVSNSTINANVSQVSGAGIFTAGAATLTNVTFDSNVANTFGAGFYSGGASTLTNVTFGDNLSSQGSSVAAYGGTLRLKNTIVAAPVAAGNCFTNGGAIVSDGSNLSNDNTCAAFFTAGGDKNNTDPMLLALALNAPGTTMTRALPKSSPAIDGVVKGCPPPATDQRGVSRPQGLACDIGAYELKP
jgi:predicted outer membrane repeat protein